MTSNTTPPAVDRFAPILRVSSPRQARSVTAYFGVAPGQFSILAAENERNRGMSEALVRSQTRFLAAASCALSATPRSSATALIPST